MKNDLHSSLRFLRAVVTAVVVLAAVGRLESASVYLPRLAFRVLVTPHFRIYYHQGEEALARRLARVAEAVRSELQGRTALGAPAVTHVVLANQDDDPNGSATPLPYPTVRLSAVWPGASDLIGNTDDWLRLVFIHEYAHTVHIEQRRGWASVARAVLGRSPIAFPNLFLPQWQIEGYATLLESRLTGLGRLNGGDAEAIVRERARAGALPLDQANGGVVEWPGGNIQYLEGAWFLDRLATRFGEGALGALNRETSGRLPYLSAPAFRTVFKRSLGELWTEFQQSMVSESRDSSTASAGAGARRVTGDGHKAGSPRFDQTAQRLFYSLSDPHAFPAIRELDLGGRTGESLPPSRHLVDRFDGRTLSVAGDLLFYDEIELRGNVAWRSDLRVVDLRSGRSRRITSDARLLEPDVSQDGSRLACVRVAEDGTRALATYRIERHGDEVTLSPTATRLPAESDATYGSPRWSPDGRRLAAERRRVKGPSEIVVIDPADGTSRVVVSLTGARATSPTWMPDGSDLLFSSDLGGPFQVYAAGAGESGLRQVTFGAGGASFPDVSRDGRLLAFVGAGSQGYDVYTTTIDRARWVAVADARGVSAPVSPERAEPEVAVEDKPYSPLATLLPRSWTPLADSQDGDVRIGFGIAGTDVLVRHSWSFSARWRVSGDNGSGAPASRPDWSASYVYDRWWPAFFVTASDDTSLLTLARSGRPPLPAALREQDASAGVSLPFTHVRVSQVWQAAFNAGTDTLSSGFASQQRRRPSFRAAWAIGTGKQYGWSISTENGVSAAVTSEQVRGSFGADGNADAFTGELRGYWRPGRSHAVLAARAGYGTSSGDAAVRRAYYLGGSTSAGPLIDFGSDAFRMLRGFHDVVASGSHVAVASVEWRQPLLRVERGWGTVPILLRNVHAAVFLDAGHAWEGGFRAADVKTSAGAEASVDLVAGFALPLTLTSGVALTRDPEAPRPTGRSFYVRVGPSF